MKRVALTLPPADDRVPGMAVLAWILCAGLSLLLLGAIADYRSLNHQLSEIDMRERNVAPSGAADLPVEPELARAEFLSSHAAIRFADWNAAFASLGSALPAGVTVERLSLNAKTGRGEAAVRMSRVADATRVAERLSTGKAAGASVVRRCDQSGARGESSVRCELELTWGNGVR